MRRPLCWLWNSWGACLGIVPVALILAATAFIFIIAPALGAGSDSCRSHPCTHPGAFVTWALLIAGVAFLVLAVAALLRFLVLASKAYARMLREY